MRFWKHPLRAVLAGLGLAALLFSGSGGSGFAAVSPNFVHGVLPPPPPGSTAQYNQAAEPQIRANTDGTFFISSENGLGAGTDAWRSVDRDDGIHYTSLPQPNAISSANASQTTGVAPGGGDTDLATAPVKNGLGVTSYDNVYVASLTLGNVTVSASQDNGRTWQNNVLTATVPVDDREWIAAYGANVYYLSYHEIGSGDQIIVNQGQVVNGIPVTLGTYDAINPGQPRIYAGTELDNEIGNLVVDQRSGKVYQVFVGCPPGPTQVVTCSNLNTAYMAVGTPTATGKGVIVLRFHDYVIYRGGPHQTFNNNFPTVAVDAAGNVYAAWSNDHDVYVSYSTDAGQQWSAPVRVNQGRAVTAIFPWLAAGAAGKVDLVYYGTPAAANYQTCPTPPSGPCQTEPWYVFFAQNLNVLGGGTWAQQQVTPMVHAGGVCQGGISCTSTGNDNRDLYDDFGVAASPVTGLAGITYSDDQYGELVGTANAGECTASQNNTVACDHTDYANQVAGSGIY